MKFGPDEPVSKCEREDCAIEDRGGQATMQQTINVYDKQGNPLPAPRAKAIMHRHCRTCGESWTVET